MEAIYNAILLIPQSPKQATRILCKLATSEHNFIQLLKTMTVQLYGRFAPHSQEQHISYETTCKQMLAILNRFITVSFKQKQNDVYLQVENYYHWILQILLCEKISLSCKKLLTPSFKKVIQSICYKPSRISEFIQHMMNNSMNSASSIFIYLGCLLDSSLDNASKFDSICESYLFLYHTANFEYRSLIDFYKNQHMDCDIVYDRSNSAFLQKLKQNDFMLSQLHNMFKLIHTIFKTNKHYKDLDSLSYQIFFSTQLAQYISCVLKMEEELLNTKQKENPYGLKFIIITSLKNQEKDVINEQKSLCLSILTIIYSLSDKEFNLIYTDKLLMKELFNLTDLIINELLICSQKDVLSNISVQLQITDIIASMFDLLSVIVLFRDLKPCFQSLNIQKIIRLAFFYTKTFEQQLSIYQSSPQEYFHFNYYICDDPLNEQEIDNEIDEFKYFSIKRKAVNFIKQMSQKMEGFHSIIMDICCDYIKLEIEEKLQYKEQYRTVFLDKYLLRHEIFSCFTMESTLFIFTILLQNSWQQHQKLKRMYFLLSTVRLSFFNNLELYRLYICLSVNHKLFILHKGHKNYYNFIQKVYKLDNKQCSTTQAGYFFLEKLIANHKDAQDYDIFVQKLLQQVSDEFQSALSLYPFQTIDNAIKIQFIAQNIIGLQWICKSLFLLNKRIMLLIQSKGSGDDILILILKLYHNFMKVAGNKIKQNKQLPYPNFQVEKNKYSEQISNLLSNSIFRYLDRLIKSQASIQESQVIIESVSRLFLQMLVQQIPIEQTKIDLLLNFTMNLLQNQNECQQQIKQKSFQLLYQLLNIRLFTFNQTIHNIILNWMKSTYFQSQMSLNRVCIILQQLYYYIDGNPHQNQYHFLMFYASIIQILQKKFLQHLFQYHNYYQALQEEMDNSIRRINQLRIDFDSRIKIKTNPVTIIRLYNTILLNPYFDITIIRKTHQMIKKYNFQIIPNYDLTLQVLALQSLINRNTNISVIQCFRFTTQLLGYNCKDHNSNIKDQSQAERRISTLTNSLKSSITAIDPYETYSNLVKRHIFRPQLVNSSYLSNRIDEIKISIIDFLQTDKYLMNLVKKLTLVRNVNSKTRIIRKIRKEINDDQFV